MTDLYLDWDLEIRKRYSQPLASETGEFPDAETIHGRMVPICYEESLPNGCAPLCANFMATATEQFIKEVLSTVYKRTRSNMPGGSVNSILTHRFKKQLRKEEEAAGRGELVRAPGSGLLPVEVKEAAARKPLGMHDLRFALELGDCGLGQFPVIVGKVMNGNPEGQWEEYQKRNRGDEEAEQMEEEKRRERLAHLNGNGVNGIHGTNGTPDDEMDDEDESWGWECDRSDAAQRPARRVSGCRTLTFASTTNAVFALRKMPLCDDRGGERRFSVCDLLVLLE